MSHAAKAVYHMLDEAKVGCVNEVALSLRQYEVLTSPNVSKSLAMCETSRPSSSDIIVCCLQVTFAL